MGGLQDMREALAVGEGDAARRAWQTAVGGGQRHLNRRPFRGEWVLDNPRQLEHLGRIIGAVEDSLANLNMASRERVVQRWRARRAQRIRENVGAMFKEFRNQTDIL